VCILLVPFIGANDVTTFLQIRTIQAVPLSTIAITYRIDGVSQELNETFSIECDLDANNSNFFPDSSENPDITIGHLNGTIIDQDSEYIKIIFVSTLYYSVWLHFFYW
jgi:hypothetical protein